MEGKIRKLIQAIKGVSATSIKKLAFEVRQAELQQRLEAPETPEALHREWRTSAVCRKNGQRTVL